MPQLNSGYDTDSSDDDSVYDNYLTTNVIPFQQNKVTHDIPGGTVQIMVTTVETSYNIVLASDPLMTSLK